MALMQLQHAHGTLSRVITTWTDRLSTHSLTPARRDYVYLLPTMAGGVSVLALLAVSILLLHTSHVSCQLGPLDIIRDLVKNNVAGTKLVNTVQKVEFDPDVADRRRVEFEKENGRLGARLIEKFGLGIDGRQEERRIEQRERDKKAGYDIKET